MEMATGTTNYLAKLEKSIEKTMVFMSATAENMKKAADVYVGAIDEFPEAKEAYRELCPQVPENVWSILERVGRRQMHESLIFGGGVAQSRLRMLPYSEQKRVMEDGVEVLAADGTALKLSADKLTTPLVRQVFIKGHVASLAEQKAIQETTKIYEKPQPVINDWETKRGRVIFYRPCELTRKDLLRILQDLER